MNSLLQQELELFLPVLEFCALFAADCCLSAFATDQLSKP